MIVLIPYKFIKPILDNKMSVFEEYIAFKYIQLKGGGYKFRGDIFFLPIGLPPFLKGIYPGEQILSF